MRPTTWFGEVVIWVGRKARDTMYRNSCKMSILASHPKTTETCWMTKQGTEASSGCFLGRPRCGPSLQVREACPGCPRLYAALVGEVILAICPHSPLTHPGAASLLNIGPPPGPAGVSGVPGVWGRRGAFLGGALCRRLGFCVAAKICESLYLHVEAGECQKVRTRLSWLLLWGSPPDSHAEMSSPGVWCRDVGPLRGE